MPKNPSCPVLQAVAEEIKNTLRRNDVGASIVLVNGNGHSEYVNFMVAPAVTWSALTIEETVEGTAIRLRSKASSAPAEDRHRERVKLQRTVNACILMRDVLTMQARAFAQMVRVIDDHMVVERGHGVHKPLGGGV